MTSKVHLHVEESGEGSPAVVLLHGFGGSARNFRPQARHLAPRHRVLLYDARGHARSGKAPTGADYGMDALVADAASVVANAGEGVVVGGLSLGGAVALHAALRDPAPLRGLVLAAYPPAGDPTESGWANAFATAIDEEGLEGAGQRFVWGGGRFDGAAARFIRQGFLEHDPVALSGILRNTLARLASPEEKKSELGSLSLPTLVIVGERDGGSLEPCRDLARLLPRAELAVVPGAGHVVNLENPLRFNEVLSDFLSRI